jgi:hypothetical protein
MINELDRGREPCAQPVCSDRRSSMSQHWAWVIVLALGACMPSQVPARQVSEVARDLNIAARFGRMDVAAEHTSETHRQRFLESRADWGTDVRVVDVELAELKVPDSENAEVIVDVSWMRIDEGMLRSTRIRQDWQNPGGGWQLNGEQRIAGDFGLLGENVTFLRPETRDAHFPTKTIR